MLLQLLCCGSTVRGWWLQLSPGLLTPSPSPPEVHSPECGAGSSWRSSGSKSQRKGTTLVTWAIKIPVWGLINETPIPDTLFLSLLWSNACLSRRKQLQLSWPWFLWDALPTLGLAVLSCKQLPCGVGGSWGRSSSTTLVDRNKELVMKGQLLLLQVALKWEQATQSSTGQT